MKTWLSFFIISFSSWGSCGFNPEIKSIYSLSGSFTTALKEVGLHQSPKLKGISSFYQTQGSEFETQRIPGGSLLSPATARSFREGVVVFDESQETEKILRAFAKGVTLKKISTRNLTPIEVTELMIDVLKDLTSGCEAELARFQSTVRSVEKDILQKLPKDFKAVFFLGGFQSLSSPDLVMANDGFVKWLREKKKIETYPTELSYVSWSAKLLKEKMGDALRIGLVDSDKADCIKKDQRKYTCHFPRALTPGIDQLRALDFILKKI